MAIEYKINFYFADTAESASGHAFVQFTQFDTVTGLYSVNEFAGFWPAAAYANGDLTNMAIGTGEVRNDDYAFINDPTGVYVSQSITVSAAQFGQARNIADFGWMNQNSIYNFFNRNCVDFAQAIYSAAGGSGELVTQLWGGANLSNLLGPVALYANIKLGGGMIGDVTEAFWGIVTDPLEDSINLIDDAMDLVEDFNGSVNDMLAWMFGANKITDTDRITVSRGDAIKVAQQLGGTIVGTTPVVHTSSSGHNLSFSQEGQTISANNQTYSLQDVMESISNASEAIGKFVLGQAEDFAAWFMSEKGAEDAFFDWMTANINNIVNGNMDADEALIALAQYMGTRFLTGQVVNVVTSYDARVTLDSVFSVMGLSGADTVLLTDKFVENLQKTITQLLANPSNLTTEQLIDAGVMMLGSTAAHFAIEKIFGASEGGPLFDVVGSVIMNVINGQEITIESVAKIVFGSTLNLLNGNALEITANIVTQAISVYLNSLTGIPAPFIDAVLDAIINNIYVGKVFYPGEGGDPSIVLNSIYQIQNITVNGQTVPALVAIDQNGATLILQQGITHSIGNVGADVMAGTTSDNYMSGLGGSDYIEGKQGNDSLFGNDGNDMINGGAGNDIIVGDTGNDMIFGEDGNDTAMGGDGDDFIHTGSGSDIVNSGANTDWVIAGAGDDAIQGDAGNDLIDSGAGDDALEGGAGNDIILGNLGNDEISGGDGDDTIYGDQNNDRLLGGNGNDYIDGGSGIDVMQGENGNDTIFGGADNDMLDGGLGNDNLVGGIGNDSLEGGMDNDTILGDEGDDTLNGGFGNDILISGAGDDTINGGAGDDVYVFGLNDGSNIINEDSGTDTIYLKGVTSSSISMSKDGNDLIISYANNSGKITIKDHFSSTQIEELELDGNQKINLSALTVNGNQVSFTTQADTVQYQSSINIKLNELQGIINEKVTQWSSGYLPNISSIAYEEALRDEISSTYYNGTEIESFYRKRSVFGGKYTVYRLKKTSNLQGNEQVSQIDELDASSNLSQYQTIYTDARKVTTTFTAVSNMLGQTIKVIDIWKGNQAISSTYEVYNSAGALVNSSEIAVSQAVEILTSSGSWINMAATDRLAYGTVQEIDLGERIINAGIDQIVGAYWDETITGGTGSDILIGNGGNDIIYGGRGNDWLYGNDGDDTITGESGDDIIFGGEGNNKISGDGGDDTIVGGSSVDTILGGAGNDYIEGAAGNDFIDTGSGNNVVYGGDGNDQIYGGTGNDTLQGQIGNDTVYGGAGNDTLYGNEGVDLLIGDSGNDTIYGGTEDDIIRGGTGADTLYGNEGNDIIYGSSGSTATVNKVFGGSGTDILFAGISTTLEGGDGADKFVFGGNGVTSSFDYAYITDFQQGLDKIDVSSFFNSFGVFGDMMIYVQGGYSYVESFLHNFAIRLTGAYNLTINDFIMGGSPVPQPTYSSSTYGNASNNNMIGTSANEAFYGQDGDDNMEGRGGADLLDGGNGIDRANYSNATGSVYVNLLTNINTGSDAQGDLLYNIENIDGSNSSDVLIADNGNNQIWGNSGHDIIYGMGGNDNIDGGAHDDTIYGGEGDDYINLNYGQNDVAYGGEGNDTITSGADSFGAKLYGNEGNDILYLVQGNDEVWGGEGDDIIYGNGSAFNVDGGEGYDILSFAASTIAVGISMTDTPIRNIEKVIGSNFNDTITGDNNNNSLFGGAGVDNLSGNGGDDYFMGGLGNDTINGGDGIDTVDYSDATSYVGVNISNGGYGGTSGGAGTDQLLSIEKVIGSNHGDSLSFTSNNGDPSGDNWVAALGGNDNITLHYGNDTAFGGDGNDIIYGEWGNDALYGEAGSDNIYGGDGNDTLSGGAVNDIIDGGNGTDKVSYIGSTAGVTINLTSGIAVSGGDATGDTLTSIEVFEGSDSNDTFYGNASANTFYGAAGNDLFYGSGGNDYVNGGAGIDRIDYSAYTSALNLYLVTNSSSNPGLSLLVMEVEEVIGTSFNDNISGDLLNNFISGGNGSDFIDGYSGADTIYGGAGDDILTGGDHNDKIYGGDGNDNIYGDKRLEGWDDYGNNELYGENGDDNIFSGVGADIINGGSGTDTLSYKLSTEGVTINMLTMQVSGGDAEGDVVVDIEKFIGSNYEDTIIGSNNSDILDGENGDDSISGNGGNDTIYLAAGSYTVNGGDGDDVIIEENTSLSLQNGGDIIDGGNGYDVLTYAWLSSNLTINLLTNINTGGYAEGDKIYNIERINGGAYNDTFTGDTSANYFYGDSGNDQMEGGAGADTLDGGYGVDTIIYASSSLGVTVNLFNGTATGGDATGDIISGFENVTGSAFNDVFFADVNANSFNGGDGIDTVSYLHSTSAVSITTYNGYITGMGSAGAAAMHTFH